VAVLSYGTVYRLVHWLLVWYRDRRSCTLPSKLHPSTPTNVDLNHVKRFTTCLHLLKRRISQIIQFNSIYLMYTTVNICIRSVPFGTQACTFKSLTRMSWPGNSSNSSDILITFSMALLMPAENRIPLHRSSL